MSCDSDNPLELSSPSPSKIPLRFNHEDRNSLSFSKVRQLKEKPNVKISFPFLVISPFSLFKNIWIVIISGSLIYTAWVFPFRLAFEPEFSIETLQGWANLDFALDVLFMLDIGVNALSAFENEDGNLVYRKIDIMREYLKFWFWIDLLSCFPFSLLGSESIFAVTNQFMKISKLPKLFRLLRLMKLVKMKTFSYNKSIKHLLERKKAIMTLLKECHSYFFLIHIASCLMYYAVQYEEQEDMGNTWTLHEGLSNKSLFQKYLTAFYFVMTIMVTTGFGNITATTYNEKVMVIVLMFLAIFFYGRVMGTLIELSMDLKQEISSFIEKADFLNELSMVFYLPTRLHERILWNFRKSKFCDKINSFQKFIGEGLFNSVDEILLSEVSLHVFQKEIGQFEFFQDKPPFFVSRMMIAMKAVFYKHGEVIFNKGDPPNYLYFILAGQVEAYFLNKNGGKMASIFLEGSFFGEIEVFFPARHQQTAFAQGDAMLWRIDSIIFMQIIDDYPEIKETLFKNAEFKKKQRNIEYENVVRFPALVPMNYWRWKHEEEKKEKLNLHQILYKQRDCYNEESRTYGRKYYAENYSVVLKDAEAQKFLAERKSGGLKQQIIEVDEEDIENKAFDNLEEYIFSEYLDVKKENLTIFERMRHRCARVRRRSDRIEILGERIRIIESELQETTVLLNDLKYFYIE